MAITINDFPAASEIFGSYESQESSLATELAVSGAVVRSAKLEEMLANGGNTFTIPFYAGIDPATLAPKMRDGSANNTPMGLEGGYQTGAVINVMAAFDTDNLSQEVSGAEALAEAAREVGDYWRAYKSTEVIKIANAVLGVSALASHVNTITSLDAGVIIDTAQKALGNKMNKFGFIVMHSRLKAEFIKLGLIEFKKYTVQNALETTVIELPTLNGFIVVDGNDADLTGGTSAAPTVEAYLFGEGAFLYADAPVKREDHFDYDPVTAGGTEALYTTRRYALHPNGMSFNIGNIAGTLPTPAEFETAANWSLAFNNAANVRIGKLSIAVSNL